jgi:AraC-like DNA-binding protein
LPGRPNAGPHDTPAVIQHRLAADPLRRWTVAQLAAALHLSPRTLQRRLTEAGRPLGRLLAETRLQTAARLLCQPDGPGLAQIGFLCGYADQPHFTRSFARAVGTTPASYRAQFRAGAARDVGRTDPRQAGR